MSNHLTPDAAIKLFAMSNQLIESDLDRVEHDLEVDLGRPRVSVPEADDYYPQFEKAVRDEAQRMAVHYEMFYCLERTIRVFIADMMRSSDGDQWWTGSRVPQLVKTEVMKRIKKEEDAGVTPRSTSELDYTTFGELGEIIKANMDVFGGVFTSVIALEKVMASLNTLRGPIAHCSPLAEDEIVRLRLSVRDWFRLME